MHVLNDDSPEPRRGQRDPACAGCPGCQPGQPAGAPDQQPERDEPELGVAQSLAAPIGLFVLPVVAAIGGAAWGNAVAMGELLGGLLGLVLGMGMAILAARVIDRRNRTRARNR